MPSKHTIIYVADPMCSWCYGIAEEVAEVLKTAGDKYDFQLVMGGLRPYNTEIIADMGEMLSHHWDSVAQRSGRTFNYEILKDKSFVYDTEPPSRAVVVVRNIKPEREFDFFKAVQVAFYLENKNTNGMETYLNICRVMDIDTKEFTKQYESESAQTAVRADFALSSRMGVRGFPTVLLKKEDEMSLLTNGYTTADKMIRRLEALEA